MLDDTNSDPAYEIGDLVQKKRGSNWRGRICGFYSTSITPQGYAIESAMEPGNVQIYPVDALKPWDGQP